MALRGPAGWLGGSLAPASAPPSAVQAGAAWCGTSLLGGRLLGRARPAWGQQQRYGLRRLLTAAAVPSTAGPGPLPGPQRRVSAMRPPSPPLQISQPPGGPGQLQAGRGGSSSAGNGGGNGAAAAPRVAQPAAVSPPRRRRTASLSRLVQPPRGPPPQAPAGGAPAPGAAPTPAWAPPAGPAPPAQAPAQQPPQPQPPAAPQFASPADRLAAARAAMARASTASGTEFSALASIRLGAAGSGESGSGSGSGSGGAPDTLSTAAASSFEAGGVTNGAGDPPAPPPSAWPVSSPPPQQPPQQQPFTHSAAQAAFRGPPPPTAASPAPARTPGPQPYPAAAPPPPGPAPGVPRPRSPSGLQLPRPLPGPPRRRSTSGLVVATPAAPSPSPQPQPLRQRAPAAVQAAAAAAQAVAAGPRWGVQVQVSVKGITMEGANGFKILRAKLLQPPQDSPDAASARLKAPRSTAFRAVGATVPLLGVLPSVAVGSTLVVRGMWEHHEKHGWQIRAVETEVQPPKGDESVAAFLAAVIKGVGPKTAQTLVAHLGAGSAVDVLSSDGAVAALAAIKGVGKSKAVKIKDEWDNSQRVRGAYRFLQGLGLSPELCHRVAGRHGERTEEVVRSDPYEALQGMPGSSWRIAEAAAERLGHDPGSPARGGAALLQVLRAAATADGHTHLPWSLLVADAMRLLDGTSRPWPSGREGLRAAALLQRVAGRLVVECETLGAAPEYGDDGAPADVAWRDDAICMSAAMWQAEADVASALVALAKRGAEHEAKARGAGSRATAAKKRAQAAAAELSSWLEAREKELSGPSGAPVRFSEGQRVAIATAVLSPACILTGGPGCGKTFATRAIAHYWVEQGKKVAMCAPTGRAAQRLTEIVGLPGLEASTIHRLLGYKGRVAGNEAAAGQPDGLGEATAPVSPGDDGADVDEELDMGIACTYNKTRPLPVDCLLVDEASMADLPLAAALLNAVDRARTQVVIVGDPDQLPPVGPGAPLRTAIESCLLPLVDLRQVFRQSGASAIVRAAHAINRGERPALDCWELGPEGAGLEQRIAALPTGPTGHRLLPSDALLLQMRNTTDPSEIEGVVARAVAGLVPALGYDITRDVQVLSPTKRGAAGVGALNQRLQPLANPAAPDRDEMPLSPNPVANAAAAAAAAAAGLPPPAWRVGDRVVQTANDYERAVWNGDLGYIAAVNAAQRQLVVRFPGQGDKGDGGGGGGKRESVGGATAVAAAQSMSGQLGFPPGGRYVVYTWREISDQLQLAWATTVHKSQGGEFPVVVLPLHRAFGSALLSRMLLYTAITRAKQLLVVVGSAEVMAAAASKGQAGRGKRDGLAGRLARAASREGLLRVEPRVFLEAAGGVEGVGDDAAA